MTFLEAATLSEASSPCGFDLKPVMPVCTAPDFFAWHTPRDWPPPLVYGYSFSVSKNPFLFSAISLTPSAGFPPWLHLSAPWWTQSTSSCSLKEQHGVLSG